jgi:hypothetical protein
MLMLIRGETIVQKLMYLDEWFKDICEDQNLTYQEKCDLLDVIEVLRKIL